MKINKTVFLSAMAAAMVLFVFSGCSKDPEPPTGSTGGGGSNTNQTVFLDANVNGGVFAKGVVPTVTFDSAKSQLVINYVKPGGADSTMTITFTISTATSLTIGGNYTPVFIVPGSGIDGFHLPTAGYLNITSNDKTKRTIGGNFEYTARSPINTTVSVTGGKFWVKY